MATTDQLVDRGKVILSRVNDSSLAAKLITELGAAQERLEQEAFLPEFLANALQVGPVITESFDLDILLPRFLRLHDRNGGIYVMDPNATTEPEVKLHQYDEFNQLIQRHPGNLATGGLPLGYNKLDTLVYLRPKPSASAPVNLVVFFYQGEVLLPAAGNTNLWTQKAGDYLLGSAGKIVAASLRDQTALQVFQGLEGTGKARLMKKVLGDEQADQDYQMGDED